MTNSKLWENLSQASQILGVFKRELFTIFLLSLAANVLLLTPTIYMLQVFDRVIVSQSGATLVAVSLLALFAFIVMGLAEWIRTRILVRVGLRLDAMINEQLFAAAFEGALIRPNANHTEPFSDLINVRQFITGPGILALFDAPWIPIYALIAAMLHPWLGWAVMFFIVSSLLLLRWSHRFTGASHQAAYDAAFPEQQFLSHNLRNSEVVMAMGMESALKAKWYRLHLDAVRAANISHDLSERAQGIVKFSQLSQASLVLALGAWLVIRGEISAGAMIAANMLVMRACQPVQMLVIMWRAALSAKISWDRLVQIFTHFSQPAADLQAPIAPSGMIKVRGLSVGLPSRQLHILQDVSLDIAPGELVTVLGPSGSGKSTFVKAVLGLGVPFSGSVHYDGLELREVDPDELGKHVGYLPQDIELFEGTIAENISRFGDLDAEKVIEAAKAAGIHDMVLRMRDGYDTELAEFNSALSGGQRQRLGLARALYGNPPILFLDEPNSNLDDVGEAALSAALSARREAGLMSVVVTHRKSLVSISDKIIAFDGGRVVANGPREAVLAPAQA